jgi:hypothetical protein
MKTGDCSLHENQRKAGTLCRSMRCTKCPPYRAKPVPQETNGPYLEKRTQERIDLATIP